MHETGVVRDLVRRVEAAARDAGAVRVASITVWLGALSQFSPEHLREHFDEEARGTLAEHARLSILTSADPRDADALSVIVRDLELEVVDVDVDR